MAMKTTGKIYFNLDYAPEFTIYPSIGGHMMHIVVIKTRSHFIGCHLKTLLVVWNFQGALIYLENLQKILWA